MTAQATPAKVLTHTEWVHKRARSIGLIPASTALKKYEYDEWDEYSTGYYGYGSYKKYTPTTGAAQISLGPAYQAYKPYVRQGDKLRTMRMQAKYTIEDVSREISADVSYMSRLSDIEQGIKFGTDLELKDLRTLYTAAGADDLLG